jgi:plastocyanin
MKRIFVFGLFVSLICTTGARAQAMPAVVAPPQAQIVGFATPVTVVSASQGALFLNVDPVIHNVASTAKGPDGNPWCARYHYAHGSCPAFRSDDVGQQVAEILGISALSPGQTYPFVCTYHGAMKGTLAVVP